MQAVFSALFFFAPIPLYQGAILVGYTTGKIVTVTIVFTMAPVFSLVYDRDISEDTAFTYPELYKDLKKGRSLTYKTFFIWLAISIYQGIIFILIFGGIIMILSISLFDTDLMRIVSITFTSLILNELLLVAVKITNWHIYMIYAQVLSLVLYIIALKILKTYFGNHFLLTSRFKFCFHNQFSMESISDHMCQFSAIFPDKSDSAKDQTGKLHKT